MRKILIIGGHISSVVAQEIAKKHDVELVHVDTVMEHKPEPYVYKLQAYHVIHEPELIDKYKPINKLRPYTTVKGGNKNKRNRRY